MVVGGLLIALTNSKTTHAMSYFFSYPWDTFIFGWEAIWEAYKALFEGAVFDPSTLSGGSFTEIMSPISETLVTATPLILVGLSVGLAFRSGLFNIGGQGQIIMGAICAGYVGFAWHLPTGLHLIVALIAGTLGGALWGGLAGWLKARTGAHEVITTIMLNYVALYLLVYLLGVGGFQRPGPNQAISKVVAPERAAAAPVRLRPPRAPRACSSPSPRLRAVLAPDAEHAGLPAACGGCQPGRGAHRGHERRAQLRRRHAARRRSRRPRRLQPDPRHQHAITGDIDAGIGFDGITVALLGRANPWGTVLAGLLFGGLKAGGLAMQSRTVDARSTW